MKTKKTIFFLASAVFAISLLCSVLTPFTPKAHAAGNTCTWTGATNNNFATTGNWTGCGGSAPNGGDNLVFNASTISAATTLTNDISSLSVGSITFSGTYTFPVAYTITGNALTVNGNISDTGNNVLDLDVTLGANISVSSTGYAATSFGTNGGTVRTLNTNGFTLTFSGGGATCGQTVYAKLAGSGGLAVNLTAGGIRLQTDATSYTGAVTVTNGVMSVNSVNALGSTSGVTVASGATLGLALSGANRTYTFPVTMAGTGFSSYGGALYATKAFTTIGCSGGGFDATAYTATMTGVLSLSGNATYTGDYVNTVATGTFNANSYTLSAASGSQGTITTSAGTAVAPKQTFTINAGDDQPGVNVSVRYNQTYIIDGIRGSVYVENGGILMGTGVVGGLNISDGGTLAPGHSPGCLTSNGNVTIGGIYSVELGGADPCSGYDQLKVTGTVIIDPNLGTPTLNVATYGGFKPATGNSYTIISNDGVDAVTGVFTSLPEGTTFNSGGYVYQITYKGGDGNDVVLTVKSVPAVPDTGVAYFQNRPLVTLIATSVIAGAVVVLARAYNKRMQAGV